MCYLLTCRGSPTARLRAAVLGVADRHAAVVQADVAPSGLVAHLGERRVRGVKVAVELEPIGKPAAQMRGHPRWSRWLLVGLPVGDLELERSRSNERRSHGLNVLIERVDVDGLFPADRSV